MASNDVEVLDPAAPVEKSTTSGFALDRRHFIAALGVAGAAAGTALISSSKAQAQQPIPNGYNQIDVINLMLQVKYLKATLYSYITQGSDLPGSSQVTVGTGQIFLAPAKITFSAAGLSSAQQITDLFNEMYYDELNQLIKLRAIQGVSVVPRQTVNLMGTGPSGGSTLPAATTTITQSQAISLARMLEDLSTSAFATATTYLTGQNLALATQILASDGAHAGAMRLLAIQTGAPYQSSFFASVATSNSAQSAITFSGQLITGNNVIYATLPTNVPLVGSVATGVGIPQGAGAVITAVTSGSNVAATAISTQSNVLSNVSKVSNLAVGQPITGTFIPAGTYIQNIGTTSPFTLTLSAATTGKSTVGPNGFITSGSTTITGVSAVTGLIVGQPITGTGIPANTTISAVGSNTITLSAAATVTPSVSLTGALTSGDPNVQNLSTLSGLVIGQPITAATGIPAGTTIIGIGSSSLTMSNNATATSAGGTATFTGIVTSGSKNITLVSSFAGLAVGQVVGGPGIAAGTTIATLTPATNTVVMSANATATSTVSVNATATSGSNILSQVGSVTGVIVGQPVTGTGIPASTTVTAIGTNTITISNNATATNVGAPFAVSAPESIFAGGQLLTTPTTAAVSSPTTEAITIGVTQITLAGNATVTGLNTISIIVPDPQDVEPGDPGSATTSASGPSAVPGTGSAVYQGFFNTAGSATSTGNTPPGFAFARSFQQILAVLYGYNSTNSIIVTQNFEGGFYPFGVSGNITSAL